MPKVVAKPVSPCATDHKTKAPAYNQRRLSRSEHKPIGICISAYDQKNADSSTPFTSGPSLRVLEIKGRAKEIVARSK